MSSEWFTQLKAWPPAEVAERFGLPVHRRGPDVSFSCPVCRKVLRHSKGADQRLAAKSTPEGGWWCEPCGAKGDVVGLVAAIVTGSVKPNEWAEVRREAAALGLCEPDARDPRAAIARKYRPPPPMAPAPSTRLPADEVASLWAASSRLDAVPSWDGKRWCDEAREYLSGRALDVPTLARIDAARVLPPAELHTWPQWWRGSWSQTWRIGVPLHDARGVMVALQARAIVPHEMKTRNPLGVGGVTGTFFADAGGLAVLRGTFTRSKVTIVEGLPDFLTAAQLAAGLPEIERPAVLGIIAGSARALTRVDVKSTYRFNVIVHDDDAGQKYFTQVREALPNNAIGRVLLREDVK